MDQLQVIGADEKQLKDIQKIAQAFGISCYLCSQDNIKPSKPLLIVPSTSVSEEQLQVLSQEKWLKPLLFFHSSLAVKGYFSSWPNHHYLGSSFDTKSLEKTLKVLASSETLVPKETLIFSKGSKMEKVYKDLKLIASSAALTVFIYGETGTGKELVAHKIHEYSKRADKAFVEINVTALPPELLESELFGHEAGAFTGAGGTKKGLFEVADKGTLFLDEIGDMDLNMQAKILRALQERKIRRVGGTSHIPVDIRLITATNKDLAKEVEKGHFRKDLFYRLNVVSLFLPPLRDRGEDIQALAKHFLKYFNILFKRQVEGISDQALDRLRHYPWPGNVRELKNMLEHTLLLECKSNFLDVKDLRFPSMNSAKSSSQKEASFNYEKPLWEVEKDHISQVLSYTQGNKNKAAKLLQIDRTTLYNKIKKYQIG